MITLRPYQNDAVNACARALKSKPTALIVMGTGAGKALTLASICKRILERNPSWRVLVLCYIQEVLESNQHACDQLGVDSGVYCAGSGKRDTHHSVIHASRDSLAANLDECGAFNVLIIDEVHAVPDFVKEGKKSRYQTIIEHYKPKYLVGLTATPYRLDGGLIYGRRKLFDSVCFDLGMDKLIQQGFLVPFSLPELKKEFDTAGIKIVKGDFETKELENRLLRDEKLVHRTMEIWLDKAQDRKCSLFFCHSVAHAKMCMEIFKEKFPWMPSAYLDGETNKTERRSLIKAVKDGEFVSIFQINTMTTGTNIPLIDCIVWLRPTMSPVLWVQGNGRGARLFAGKSSCLVIDTVGNMQTFGSITNPMIAASGKAKKMEFLPEELKAMGLEPDDVKGKAPTKECKACKEILHAAAKKCDVCGQLQLKDIELHHQQTEQTYKLTNIQISHTVTSKGFPCLKCEYKTEKRKVFTEWLRKDQVWQKPTIQKRLALMQTGASHLKVKHNQKNPMYPHLDPFIQNPSCNVSPSLAYASQGSTSGAITQSEFTTAERKPTDSEALEA